MSLQGGRFASEQIYTPEAVLEVTNEGQPGWPPGARFRSVVTGENPSNHVFVDGDSESQGNLLSDARTAPGGIALLHLDDGFKGVLCQAPLGRASPCAGMRRAGYTFGSSEPGGGSKGSKVSERWLNGSGGECERREHITGDEAI